MLYMHREAWSMNKIIAFLKQFLFFSATHSVLYIIGNSNFPTTRIVESPERRFDSEGALKFDAWRSAAFTFPYKTRIAQFPAEARIISVSNKIQRQTLAGNARFLLTPKAPPSARQSRFFLTLSFLLQIQFSVASLHHNPHPAPLILHSSAGETLREITLNIYLRDDCSRRYDGINIIM